MAHTRMFDQLLASIRLGLTAERHSISTSEAVERKAEADWRRTRDLDRRRFLGVVGGAAVGTALAAKGFAKAKVGSAPRIVIVGGGLAGLVCADTLAGKGFSATVYEANSRVGGRIATRLPGKSPSWAAR